MTPPQSDNPWKTRGSREVYVNPWIRVREDHVIRADGNDGIYGVVEFQNYALGIVPVTDNGDTFLVGQWRYPLDLYSWEIPEGGGPLGVPLEDSARRELEEETGLTASAWTGLGLFHLSNSVTNEAGQIFLAQDLTLGDARPEGDEVLALRRLPLTEAYAMAMDGRITDGVSIIGLSRAVRYLGTHPGASANPPETGKVKSFGRRKSRQRPLLTSPRLPVSGGQALVPGGCLTYLSISCIMSA